MTNNVGLTFSVGDTTPWFTISIEQDDLELVTVNIIFIVGSRHAKEYKLT
jgi:hypothetical protein